MTRRLMGIGFAVLLMIGMALPASAGRIVEIYNNGPLVVTHRGCDTGVCSDIVFDLTRSKFSPKWAYAAAGALIDFYPGPALTLALADLMQSGTKMVTKTVIAAKIERVFRKAKKAGSKKVYIKVPSWGYYIY